MLTGHESFLMTGVKKAKCVSCFLAFMLVLVLCQSLFCDSTSELQKAQDLLAKGSLSEAVAVLRHVVQNDPSNIDAHLSFGTALALEGLRDQSLQQVETAIKLAPNSAKAQNQLGIILSRFLETGAARKAFENALVLEPNFAEAHVNLALVLAETGELPPAHKHLDQAIELYGATPPAAKVYFLRAKVWSAEGNNDNAISDLERDTQLNPHDADAWFDLSQLKHSKDDLDGALMTAKKAVYLSPKNADVQSWLGRLYFEKGDATSAVQHLEIASSLGSNDKSTLYALARALRASGKDQEAKRVDEKVIELQRLNTQAGDVLFAASGANEEGLKLERDGDLPDALEKYRKAVDLDPTGYGFRLNYALALCRLGRWQNGIVQLHEVLKEDPDNVDAAKALFIAQEQLAKGNR